MEGESTGYETEYEGIVSSCIDSCLIWPVRRRNNQRRPPTLALWCTQRFQRQLVKQICESLSCSLFQRKASLYARVLDTGFVGAGGLVVARGCLRRMCRSCGQKYRGRGGVRERRGGGIRVRRD